MKRWQIRTMLNMEADTDTHFDHYETAAYRLYDHLIDLARTAQDSGQRLAGHHLPMTVEHLTGARRAARRHRRRRDRTPHPRTA